MFFVLLLFQGLAFGQAPEKRFVGTCSFSGFSLVADSTYRGNITRFDDRMGDGYNLTQLTTDYEIFDGRGLVFEIDTIHSSTNFTADVSVTAKVDRGFEPFGSGQVYYPTANGLIPPASQEQAGLSPTQKARIDRHNVVVMQSLIGGRDSVYQITNVSDTTTLFPVVGDAFITAAADTLGLYSGAAWLLFSGGTPLPDSLVYQSELADTSTVLRSLLAPLTGPTTELLYYGSGGEIESEPDLNYQFISNQLQTPNVWVKGSVLLMNSSTDLEWFSNNIGIRYNSANGDMEYYNGPSGNYSWWYGGESGDHLMFLDNGPDAKLGLGFNFRTPAYTLHLQDGAGTAMKMQPTTAPANTEGVIYANDAANRLRYMDGVDDHSLAYTSDLNGFISAPDTLGVLKETTSQSLSATASYTRITGLETTGLAQEVSLTDSTLTASQAGTYRITYNFSIEIAASGGGTWLVQFQPYNNAATIPEALGTVQVVTGGAETWRQVVSGETIMDLSASDVISLRYTATAGPTYTLYPGTITIEKL